VILPKLTGLWHSPDFLKLWAGQTVSVFGSIVGGFAIDLTAVLLLAATPTQMSILRVAEIGPVIVFGLVAGVWVDRLRRRRVMIVADLGRAIVLASIPAAALFGILGAGQLFAVAAATSVLGLFFDVAYPSYLPSLVERERLLEGNSKLQATNSIAEVSGFGLAGALVQTITAPITILVDAISFLASALSLSLIRKPEPPRRGAEETGAWREIVEGLRLVRGDRVLRAFAIVEGIRSFFGHGFFGTLIVIYCARDLGLTPGVMGVLFSLGGISAFFGALLAEPLTRRWGTRSTLLRVYLFSAAFALLYPLAGGSPILVLVCLAVPQLLGDGADTVFEVSRTSLLQTITPDRLLGRMNASMRFVGMTAMLAGSLVGGALGQTVGLRPTLLVAVIGTALAAFWLARLPKVGGGMRIG
jgi:predicted MFS family arabinose efflux permease